MSYQFIDAYSSVITADSSVISPGLQRPILNIGSILSPIGIALVGSPSISGAVTVVGNPSISGTVAATQQGAWTTSVVGGVSVLGGTVGVTQVGAWATSMVGVASVSQAGNWIFQPQSVSGAGIFNINATGNGSIITVSQGSVAAFQAGTWNPSTIGQITRIDTVSSFLGVALTPRPLAGDSAGRTIIKPFAPDAASIAGTGSVNGAASVAVIGAPPTGLRNYITDIFIANTGATATLVRFTAGGASVLGYTIAPAGSGSNLPGLATPIAVPAGSPFNIAADTASSTVYGTAYGYVAQ